MESYLTLLGFGDKGYGDEIAFGLLVTTTLAFATLPFGLVVGFLLALAKESSEKSLRIAADIYTTIFRGLPELLTLFLVYYGLQIGLHKLVTFLGLSADIEINTFAAGLVALGVVFSTYASEVFLSAFKAIPYGQYEAGDALGLHRGQTLWKIIVPQLIRISLPGLVNLWMVLLKDTALVSIIGLSDILRQTGIAARVTKQAFLFFGVACLLYLVLAMFSSILIVWIERWTKRSEAIR